MRVLVPLCAIVTLAAAQPRVPWQPHASNVTSRLRGVSAVSERVVWASGANGTVLRTTDGGANWQRLTVPDTSALDFRDVDAFSDRVAYVLSIGPGEASRIFNTTDGGATWTQQFRNTDPKMFLDAMAFRDERRGFAFSDSVDGAFVIFETANGGATWTRIDPARLPAALADEGAYAASGTNVTVLGDHIWIGTTKSRVLRSADAGSTWSVTEAPLATGPSAGIFSIAFRDARYGIVVGGDYREESEAIENVAFTTDGGVSWSPVVGRGLSGFRSAVAWVPAMSNTAIAVGPSGTDWTTDGGRTWAPLPAGSSNAQQVGYHAFSFARGTSTGWGVGEGGRIGRLRLLIRP